MSSYLILRIERKLSYSINVRARIKAGSDTGRIRMKKIATIMFGKEVRNLPSMNWTNVADTTNQRKNIRTII